jgi:transcription antitermination factor NusG
MLAPMTPPEGLGEPFPWYAVRVKPNFDRHVAVSLSAKGYETFAPTYSRVSQWSDRTKLLDLPLFAGYVFCRFDIDRPLSILKSPGVLSVLSFGSVCVPIDEHEIEAVQRLIASGRHIGPADIPSIGERVRIKYGPLEGVEGILLQQKGHFRLVVTINMLQRAVSAEFDRDQVEPVKPRHYIQPALCMSR